MFRFDTHFQTLATRILLCIGLPILVLIGLAGSFVMNALERQFERRMQEDVEMVARALQKPVSHALERQRDGSLRSALESALDIGRVYRACLYNEKGVLLASLGTVTDRHRPDNAANLQHQPKGGGQYGMLQGEPVYSFYVPVRLGGDRGTGLLRIARRKTDINTFMARFRIAGVVVLLGVTALMTVILILGYRRAAGSAFQNLHQSIKRIGAGDRTHRAKIRGPYEIRCVAEELNSMLDSIQRAKERLDRSREERFELQNQLTASEKLASIGRLAAGIAHEIGTPLGTVEGRLQRLMRRSDLTDPTSREIKAMSTEVTRMERIVREVLDFGRRDTLRCRRVEAGALMSSVCTLVMAQVKKTNVGQLKLFSADTPMFLSVDPSRIEQAFVNLIRNAFQWAPEGNVTLRWYPTKTQACFVLEDDGPGVPVELRKRIFDPFFTTRREKGTGLGLAIVSAIVHEHSGVIKVRDSDLGGARFDISLPIESVVSQPCTNDVSPGKVAFNAS